ncbi:MAG: SDR family NAD(P)-dependent oxidoreductase [Patescibacteria group bacterium]
MEPTPLKQIIDLSSKVAIVTGGAMGIGFGIAYRLAEAGASVVIADLDKAAAEKAAATLTANGWKALAIDADVSIEDQAARMMQTAVSTFGGIDILINNAGIYPTIPVMQMQAKDFDRILSTNVKSAFLCTKMAADQMIRQGRGGKIINITSIDALHPSAVGLAAYDASKHGLWGFTKNTALELAPHKIWVNAIAPGGIATPGTGVGKPVSKELENIKKLFLAKIPMHRMGESDEIGKVALFLASDLSSYMTGSQVIVDGGVLLA